ncbi:UBX domain-containing protein 1-like [Solanum pennellii]|uniref:UBX domain-containing protein 1-like n=1 Tax=Solanum pennellii TaxID=28526 RepID=A0ABM1HKI3_SOLPN|nr:UBX domain-containing protein 1-like [Solanum pennellii]XP_015086763.1 UBX domain-containing protein 1-like [Solanum pennellii]XP_027775329.1 UBX domain-containing protein 1-like [Solanum pennellii]
MDASEINRSLVSELEAMGFSEAQATKALCSSGNSSLEAAVNWIVDHEDEANNDEMPMVSVDIIETPTPTFDSEQAKLKAQELRERARKRREEEEKKLDKEREKERIRAGKERLATKRMAEENERKRFEAQRKTEKEEERRARERIRQKLQQDMADRRARLGSSFNSGTSSKFIKTSEPETKNPLKVDSAALSGNLITNKEVFMGCLRSLRRQHKEEDVKVQQAFKTLLVYVRNIVSNPDEGKFRKIRLSNPAFQARVGIFKEGVQFLQLCGFERAEEGDFLVLRSNKVNMALLRSAGMVLHSAITNPFFGLLSK